MMNKLEKSALNLIVLGQSISVSCPSQEVESLSASARHLEEKLFELRKAYPALNIDKLIAMLALQLVHESLRLKHDEDAINSLLKRAIEDLDRHIAKSAELTSVSSRLVESA